MNDDAERLRRMGLARGVDVETTRRMKFRTGTGGEFRTAPPGLQGSPESGIPLTTPGMAPFARLLFPPRIEKLPSSIDFRAQDFAGAVPAGVNNTLVSANSQFRLPMDHVGWLQGFTLYLLSPLATTRLQWTVRINQGPVPGFDNIQNPPGVANFELIITNDMRVRVPNGALVDVLITNLDGAAVTAGSVIQGWYHPRTDELRYFGEDT